jgi:hypothetical protein
MVSFPHDSTILVSMARSLDNTTNMVAETTANTVLNGKLYAKLFVSLEGQALQDVAYWPHLRADGILLLQELIQTYKTKNGPEVLAGKAGEFWSKTKRAPNESVDSYYNSFHELLEDLIHADDKISTKSAMRNFIYYSWSRIFAFPKQSSN